MVEDVLFHLIERFFLMCHDVTEGISRNVSSPTSSRGFFYHEAFQNTLELVHQSTRLDYWKIIVMGTFVVRTVVTFPLSLYQRILMNRWKSIVLTEMTKWKIDFEPRFLREAKRDKLSYVQYQETWKGLVRERSRSLFKERGFHPWKLILLPVVQIPLFITLSLILRNVLLHSLTMKSGGTLWFQDLTVSDPTLLFPILIATTHLINNEFHGRKELSNRSTSITNTLHQWSIYFGRFLSLVMIPITCYVPSGIAVYWLTSSLYSVLQNVVLNYIVENHRSLQSVEKKTPKTSGTT